jgi:hypothetical protein
MIRSAADFLAPSRSGRAVARTTAVLGLIAVVVLSLYPHGLPMRTGLLPGPAEHFLAYVIEGALLAYAFPRHVWMAIVLLIGSAATLELFQNLVERHPHMIDASAGAAGAIAGCALGWCAHVLQAWAEPRDDREPSDRPRQPA